MITAFVLMQSNSNKKCSIQKTFTVHVIYMSTTVEVKTTALAYVTGFIPT